MSATPSIRRFRYTLDGHDVTLAIDTAVLSEEMAHDINDFLSGKEDRLRKCDGDIYRVVGRMFAFGLMRYLLSTEGGFVDKGSSTYFVESTLRWFREGWPGADQLGITIEDACVETIEEWSLDDDELEGGEA